MEYIAGNTNFKFQNSVVTLGKFDGIHMGHQHLLNQVYRYKQEGYTAIMFTFLYHPQNLISDKEIELIYTEDEKKAKLMDSDIDVLISYPFTEETKKIEPEEFIRDILVGKLDAKIIVIGSDFRFGLHRRGNAKLLQKYEDVYGYKVIVCDKLEWNTAVISSSMIRAQLKDGNIEAVNEMLGRPYSIIGEVTHGKKIGRTLGMPTTNIVPSANKLLPPNGVYASKSFIDGVWYPGVTNIGYKPTVDNIVPEIGVETYIFDYDNDLYGKTIEVALYHYVRSEIKFNSLEELKQQMYADTEFCKDYFMK